MRTGSQNNLVGLLTQRAVLAAIVIVGSLVSYGLQKRSNEPFPPANPVSDQLSNPMVVAVDSPIPQDKIEDRIDRFYAEFSANDEAIRQIGEHAVNYRNARENIEKFEKLLIKAEDLGNERLISEFTGKIDGELRRIAITEGDIEILTEQFRPKLPAVASHSSNSPMSWTRAMEITENLKGAGNVLQPGILELPPEAVKSGHEN